MLEEEESGAQTEIKNGYRSYGKKNIRVERAFRTAEIGNNVSAAALYGRFCVIAQQLKQI